MFAERGIQGASVDEVAAEAGLTKGAVYSNFDGKEDLRIWCSPSCGTGSGGRRGRRRSECFTAGVRRGSWRRSSARTGWTARGAAGRTGSRG
ncbi:TetR/AcrR family transcriptional regulator [Nonomuraea thailandensis]|uniref:TetR/AcrR family transcriptional regulator n=1 Tax=Nonomuraea thailandensis TaxID=1188745 RepID=UPI0020A27132|nr:helix-turn-helix domain-containing protein [Nonomuraea thailandensis]